MDKLAIVVLNYLNYKDTIECVDSILKMKYRIQGVVIVDNASDNKSYCRLHREYRHNNKIIVVRTRKNMGFAKGNNVGIHIARQRLQAEFVFVVNNDTIFRDEDFFDKMLGQYSTGIGVMGPEIHLKGNKIQDRFLVNLNMKDALKIYIREFLAYRNKEIWQKVLFPTITWGNKKEVLHGCALLFTPDFFEKYPGFYPKTFLYNEEGILYLMCKASGLEQKYVSNTYIYHKEDQSSEQSFHNDSQIMRSYRLQSYKYLLWWIWKVNIVKDKVKM